MLLKISGSFLIIFSSWFLGYKISKRIAGRPEELREVSQLLEILETEFRYMADVLTDAFARVCKNSSSRTVIFFKRCSEILQTSPNINAKEAWGMAIKEVIPETYLNSEDANILCDFGKRLGMSDLDGQIANIHLTISRLKIQEKKADEVKNKNEIMYKRLGILGGICLVLLLF